MKIAWLIAPDTHRYAGKLLEACKLLVSFPSSLFLLLSTTFLFFSELFWHLLLQSICRSPLTPLIALVFQNLSSAPQALHCSSICVKLLVLKYKDLGGWGLSFFTSHLSPLPSLRVAASRILSWKDPRTKHLRYKGRDSVIKSENVQA